MEKVLSKEKHQPKLIQAQSSFSIGQKPEVTPERPTVLASVTEEKRLPTNLHGEGKIIIRKTTDGNDEMDFSSNKLYDLEILNGLPSR